MKIFDWLNQITLKKGKWESFSESDQKKFQTYIINRFLSMNMDYIDIVNEIQQYTNGQLKDKEVYNIYKNVLPRKKGFFGYIKGSKKVKYNPELLEHLKIYFEVSNRELEDYLNIMSNNDVANILQKFGFSQKEIKKLL